MVRFWVSSVRAGESAVIRKRTKPLKQNLCSPRTIDAEAGKHLVVKKTQSSSGRNILRSVSSGSEHISCGPEGVKASLHASR